jgi:transposase
MAKNDSKTGERKATKKAATAEQAGTGGAPSRVAGSPEGDDEHWTLVGMDLAKENSQLCIQTQLGVILEKRIRTDRATLEQVFGGRAPMQVLMEAGTESEWVAQCLESLGHKVIVADPNFAPMYATRNRKIKTDKRDAQALLDALRAGTYRIAHRRSEGQRDIRVQLLIRDHLVRARTKSINVSRAVLRQYGVRVPAGEAESFVERAERLLTVDAVGMQVKEAVWHLLQQQRELNEKIAQMDKQMEQESRQQEPVQRLMTAPGVGVVTALAMVALVDQAERFDNAKQIRSYVGLVPGEYSSGEGQRRTGITKTGDGMVRRLLVQCAHTLMHTKGQEAQELRNWARRLKDKSGKKIATVALARKLAGILWAMLRDGTRFGQRSNQPAVAAAA